jgi:uncharacterized protein (UPF0332 family)
MSFEKEDIIKYRIEKAHLTFQEAQSLIQSEFWSGAVNRLYYSCYHIVKALLLKNDIKASTHNGVRTEFFKYYIKTRILDKKASILYSDLMNKRQESDYDDFFEFEKADIIPLIDEVKEFLIQIEKLISE